MGHLGSNGSRACIFRALHGFSRSVGDLLLRLMPTLPAIVGQQPQPVQRDLIMKTPDPVKSSQFVSRPASVVPLTVVPEPHRTGPSVASKRRPFAALWLGTAKFRAAKNSATEVHHPLPGCAGAEQPADVLTVNDDLS